MQIPGSVIRIALVVLAVVFGTPGFAPAESRMLPSQGQTLYVPVYSNVFSGNKALPFNLAVTLSLRNTDPRHGLRILAIDYFNNDGKLLKKYLTQPMTLGPLASDHIFIRESDESGGFGANFIVRWEADRAINPPIVESVMIGARSGQGISFLSRGQVLDETAR